MRENAENQVPRGREMNFVPGLEHSAGADLVPIGVQEKENLPAEIVDIGIHPCGRPHASAAETDDPFAKDLPAITVIIDDQ